MGKPIIWEEKLSMVCRQCGAKVTYTPSFDLNLFVESLSGFSKAHKICKEQSTTASIAASEVKG